MAHAIRTGCAACRSVARSFSWTGTQPPWSRAHALVRISLLQGAVAAAAGGRGRHHLLRQTHVSKRLPAACKAPVSYRQGGKDRRAARAGRTEQWREQVGNQSSESVVCVCARAQIGVLLYVCMRVLVCRAGDTHTQDQILAVRRHTESVTAGFARGPRNGGGRAHQGRRRPRTIGARFSQKRLLGHLERFLPSPRPPPLVGSRCRRRGQGR